MVKVSEWIKENKEMIKAIKKKAGEVGYMKSHQILEECIIKFNESLEKI